MARERDREREREEEGEGERDARSPAPVIACGSRISALSTAAGPCLVGQVELVHVIVVREDPENPIPPPNATLKIERWMDGWMDDKQRQISICVLRNRTGRRGCSSSRRTRCVARGSGNPRGVRGRGGSKAPYRAA